MCLDMRFEPEVEKKMIAKLPDGLITVYKVVRVKENRYKPLCFWDAANFKTGMNKAEVVKINSWYLAYFSGYHSFRAVSGRRMFDKRDPCIKFQIRKKWIAAIGTQEGHVVYVTDRIISPSLRDKSAVVE